MDANFTSILYCRSLLVGDMFFVPSVCVDCKLCYGLFSFRLRGRGGMQSAGQSRASKGVGGGGSELECGGGEDSLDRGPRTAEQVQAAKQLSRLLRNQRATLKRNRQKRMMQIEEALNTFGYWKGNLLDVGPDFDVRRWQEIVGNIAPERWEDLFQVLYSSREDDRMRQFAYIGGEGCSAEELEALNLLQALHDSLFCVTEIDGGDAEAGVGGVGARANEGETERMGSTLSLIHI